MTFKSLIWTQSVCALLFLTSTAWSFGADNATAFALIKEGNHYVGEQSKDKIVQIRSERSVGSLSPNVWYLVYYDPTATLKATEVKFGAGRMLSVKRPLRLLEPVTGGDLPLHRDQLKVDSDQAIKTASNDPMLKNLTLTSAQLKLERVGEGVLGEGGTGQAVWKIKFWAAKLRNPRKTVDIGEIWISAADDKIIKEDLHVDRVD